MPKLDETEAAGVLNAWVMQYNHSVPKRVQDCVTASDCTLPLYAKVLAWQTSWEQGVAPRGNLDEQLQLLLDQLEEILGQQQTAHAAALLSAAKYGVSDSEMLDLLAHDAAFHSAETHGKHDAPARPGPGAVRPWDLPLHSPLTPLPVRFQWLGHPPACSGRASTS